MTTKNSSSMILNPYFCGLVMRGGKIQRVAMMFVFLIAMLFPTIVSAGQRTAFAEGSPTIRSGFTLRNGSTVWLSGRLVAAGGVPVKSAKVTLYLNADRKEFRIGSIRTDENGRFRFAKKIQFPLGSVSPSGKNVTWAAEFVPVGGDLAGSTTRNYIHGWGFRVTP